MKITAIRIRKLVSRATGYGHDAAEIEAAVEDGEDPAAVAEELHRLVDTQIRQGADADRLRYTLDDLRSEVVRLERQKLALAQDIGKQAEAISKHEVLAEMAAKAGIKLGPVLDNLVMPF